MRMRMGAQQYCSGTDNDHDASEVSLIILHGSGNCQQRRTMPESVSELAHVCAPRCQKLITGKILSPPFNLRDYNHPRSVYDKVDRRGGHSLTSGDSC